MSGSTEDFFAGDPAARRIHDRLLVDLGAPAGVEARISRSQIAYRLGRTFALVWRPGRYLHSDVPLVLSLPLRERLDSPRFKEVVAVTRDTWMHHLELRSPEEVDEEVAAWIRLAQQQAAQRERT